MRIHYFVRFVLVTSIAALPQVSFGQDAKAPRACCSVHLWWQPDAQMVDGIDGPLEATAFYNELTVEKSTRGSYFMACGFSKGYFGIQELGNGWIQVTSKTGSKWLPLTRARFTADNTPIKNIDSGAVGDRIFLQTGGDTENANTKLRDTTQLHVAKRKPPLDLPNPFSAGEVWPTRGIRVLAYNVKHGRGNDGKVDLERTARVIRRLNPDVIALQEIDKKAERSGNVDEARKLADLTGLKHHVFGRFFDFQGGEYGMAIISRYPVSDVKNLRLPDGAEPRTSLIATVGAAQPFRLASVHFYRTEPERVAQAKTLLEFLDSKNDIPCIIAGDFNSKPDSPVLKLFSDWNIPDKGDDHFTFSSDKPSIEIDFIMYRPDTAFVVREIDVVEEPVASDHRPLSVDLSIVPERAARGGR